jgi:hypothetical protein
MTALFLGGLVVVYAGEASPHHAFAAPGIDNVGGNMEEKTCVSALLSQRGSLMPRRRRPMGR